MAHGPDTEELLRRLAYATDISDILDVSRLNITSLPPLPNSLKNLDCSHTPIIKLPPLPESLTFLDCSYTQITEIPRLPDSLKHLLCDNISSLTSLPHLPNLLQYLWCNNTNIIELPPLPESLLWLHSENCPYLLIQRMKEESTQTYKNCWRAYHEEQKRIQDRCAIIKEDLMQTAWHPRRIEALGGFDCIDVM